MDGKLKSIFYLLFAARMAVVVWEIASVNRSLERMGRRDGGFRPGSVMERLSMGAATFFQNQISAASARSAQLALTLKSLVLNLLVVSAVFSTRARKKVVQVSSKALRHINPEVVLLTLLLSAIAAVEMYTGKLVLMNKAYLVHQIAYPLNLIVFFLVGIPSVVYISMKLLEVLGRKFILACYIAFLMDDLLEVLGDKGPGGKMRVPLEMFPEEIRECLRVERLENSVFASANSRGKKNAALVGLGKSRRIEIYGRFDPRHSEELHSVIMHEIGHSVDGTIPKRKILKHALFLCETALLSWMYMRRGKMFGCADVSAQGFFILLFIVYLISGRPWLFTIFNMYTQRSELSADEFARTHGYGKSLSQILFKVAMEHGAYLDPSFLHHAMTSLHPSTRLRIERCAG